MAIVVGERTEDSGDESGWAGDNASPGLYRL